jgi:choline-sulfatase
MFHRTGSPGPPRHLPTDIPNLATILKQAGYPRVEWHGKWHVGKTPADYGFEGWQPPDAGNYLAVNDTLGGGTPDNDGRFLKDLCNSLEKYKHNNSQQQQQPPEEEGGDPNQSTTATTKSKSEEPFCVVASFVNPHDVYVAQHGPAKGYTQDDLHKVKVPLPSNYMEDTDKNGKPRAHGQMSSRYVPFECTHQEYVNFYAYLHTVVDAQIGTLLDKVDDLGFTDSTLILRTADHGEQGLSHSLVEKFFNCYQESLRIPFVVSNPIAFPEPRSTDALSSHLDILPTLAGLLGLQHNSETTKTLQGTNLSPVLDDPYLTTTTTIKAGSGDENENENGDARNTKEEETFPGIQKSIHFTYDDISFPGAPSTIRCLHKGTLKYAVYFTPNGRDTDWELYDLTKDPLENTNLAGKPEYREVQKSLERELYETMVEKETLPTAFRWPPKHTRYSQGFDHPPGGELKVPPRRNPREEEEEDDDDPIQSYTFSDEGECVSISLGMENIGTQCSKKDIELVIDEKSGSLVLVLQNFLPEPISLSFGRPYAEMTDVKYSLSDNELVLTMTKKDPGIEWKSFQS